MNTPTDKEVRDWYMGYGVEGRAELAEVEGDAFDRYLLERDAKVAKATEERIIKLLEGHLGAYENTPDVTPDFGIEVAIGLVKALIKVEQPDHLGNAIQATVWAYTEGEK